MDRALTFVALALFLGTGLTACGDDSSGPQGLRIRIQGTVTESVNGLPLEAALIAVGELTGQPGSAPVATAQTDVQGRYSLSFIAKEPCEVSGPIVSPYAFSVIRSGYIAPVAIGFPECSDTLQVRDVEMIPSP